LKIQIKSNAAWDRLCEITTSLFSQYGSRPAAFRAACKLHPDLAAVAVDSTGKRLMAEKRPESGAAPKVQPSTADGQARPWTEVLRAIGAIKAEKADAMDGAQSSQGKALPWREIMRKIEAEGRA